MAKFTTNKKNELDQAQELFATVGTKYIKEWTDKQLKTYINEPVVIPVGSYGFLIGPYTIQGKNSTCWRVEQQDGRVLHDFVSKINANTTLQIISAHPDRSEPQKYVNVLLCVDVLRGAACRTRQSSREHLHGQVRVLAIHGAPESPRR